MRLRFVEDRRTLFWAFVLFPLVPALALARPALLPWLVAPALYLSYCSGVLAHNHNHCPVFRGRRSNLYYGAWLSVFYGTPLCAWVPTHNQNHHHYLNGEGDVTQTTRRGTKDTLLSALKYPLWSARSQLPLLAAYVKEAFAAARSGRPARRRRLVTELCALGFAHFTVLGLGVTLHGARVGVLVYLASAGLPALLAPSLMMFTNYLQHAGCDPSSPDDHSRNFTSKVMNWFVFENGLHTVHHEQPGAHWSRLRALHEARAHRIRPALNQENLFGYVVWTYLATPFARRGRAP